MLSPTSGYTPAQDKLLNKLVDGIYDDFVAKVAAGRGLSPAEARRLAKGRVYTGADAKNARLVDDLGGLEDAVRIAKELSGLPEEAQVNVVGKLTRAEAFRWRLPPGRLAGILIWHRVRAASPCESSEIQCQYFTLFTHHLLSTFPNSLVLTQRPCRLQLPETFCLRRDIFTWEPFCCDTVETRNS